MSNPLLAAIFLALIVLAVLAAATGIVALIEIAKHEWELREGRRSLWDDD